MKKGATITTDASFHPGTRAAEYAFQINFEGQRIRVAGVFQSFIYTPEEAEIMAIGNAFAKIMKMEWPELDWIVINSDCMHGVKKIKNRSTKLSRKVAKLERRVRKKFNVKKVRYRHVKAHSNIDDARSHVNRWCDKHAKMKMRERLAVLKSSTNS